MSEKLDILESLAADYILGTLDAAERRRVEARLEHEPELARFVDEWTQRLSPIAEAVPPVDPPPHVWHRIEAGLDSRSHPAPEKVYLEPLRRQVSFWRWFAVGASALAASLAVYIGIGIALVTPDLETRYVAVLNEGDASPAWLVSIDIADRTLTIRPVADVTVAQKSLELWLVRGSESPPQSLGLLNPTQPLSIPISAAVSQDVYSKAVLAVSLEPEGGSPTGLPTGPVVYQGTLLPM